MGFLHNLVRVVTGGIGVPVAHAAARQDSGYISSDSSMTVSHGSDSDVVTISSGTGAQRTTSVVDVHGNEQLRQELESDLLQSLRYLASHGYAAGSTRFLPSNIYLGDNGHGSYGDDSGWHLSTVDRDTVLSKTTQSFLHTVYPNLGYAGTEALSLAIDNGTSGLANRTYNQNDVNLTGNDYSQAYTDYQNGRITLQEMNARQAAVANNPQAMAEALSAISQNVGNGFLSRLLQNINSINGDGVLTGSELYSAAIQTDNELNNGADSAMIRSTLAQHGITA